MRVRRSEFMCYECTGEIWMSRSEVMDGAESSLRCADCQLASHDITEQEHKELKKEQAMPAARMRQLKKIWARNEVKKCAI